jgi:YT521-B-like domain
MTSAISNHAQTIPDTADSSENMAYIHTPATEFAPEGRITKDLARGTIFWESMLSENEKEQVETGEGDTNGGSSQMRGNTFNVEWLSTSKIPFYLTRGLRNAWNSNREVKIARDGTELESGVGRRLVELFHKPGYPPSSFARPVSRHISPYTPVLS